MRKYCYSVQEVCNSNLSTDREELLQSILDRMGKDEWELITTFDNKYLIFKKVDCLKNKDSEVLLCNKLRELNDEKLSFELDIDYAIKNFNKIVWSVEGKKEFNRLTAAFKGKQKEIDEVTILLNNLDSERK